VAIVRGFTNSMSEVISFRLNKDNQCEQKALLILHEWRIKGYSIRQTITEALLKLDQNLQGSENNTIEDLIEALSQANNLLRKIETLNTYSVTSHSNKIKSDILSANFIASVKRSAKSGMKLDPA